MRLLYKQLTKQIGQSKVFVSLLLLLTCLTSLSFFFVKFSIDGNMAVLNTYTSLNGNQLKYKDALLSNTSLAYIFFLSMAGLTAFVFVMFFYRFFRSAKKQIGCLKSLGFKDSSLQVFFAAFTAGISLTGAAAGMPCGYLLADILIQANEKTYSVSGLIKAVNPASILIGLLGSTAIFCCTAFLCYFFIHGKEPGLLISGKSTAQAISGGLTAADRIVKVIPVKDKFPLRIALRKPLAVILIFVAVMSFNVCIILGQSLNISNQKALEAQAAEDYHTQEMDVTSNKTSSAINQVVGAVIGCILLFLALYLNFQDNQRDISILKLLGYSRKEIRKMLIYIYRPIVWTAFAITLIPSILTAKSILKSLSAAINDDIPFEINIMVIFLLFVSLNMIYLLVEIIFSIGVFRSSAHAGFHNN